MTPERFRAITSRYASLRIAIVGDFCLDRYLEIDPALGETSIETGLPVHNVARVRAQPGGAGTILNNLVALGVGRIVPVGFCGDDGEGYELKRELGARQGVELDHFVTSPERRTFTYCKPLVVEPGREPVELNRLDSKNWTPTPGRAGAASGRGTPGDRPGDGCDDRAGAGGPSPRRASSPAACSTSSASWPPRRPDCRSWPIRVEAWPAGRPELQDERGRAGGDPETRGAPDRSTWR